MQFLAVALAVVQTCVLKEEAQLIPGNAVAGSSYGFSVDLGSGRLVVGAPGQPSPLGGARGAVYVYDLIGGNWVQQAELGDVLFPLPYGMFGLSVSLDGDQLAVGAVDVQAPGQKGFGAAYVFKKVAGTWTQETVITPSAGPGDWVIGAGRSVDLEGDTLLIGCAYKVTPDPKVRGRALVYSRGPTGWSQQWVLKLDEVDDSETAFGVSVLLKGDVALVGSPIAHGMQPYAGGVYVYQRIGTTWVLRQKLIASDGRSGDQFGWSIAAADDSIVIGAPKADHPAEADIGAAYVYLRQGKKWIEKQKLTSTSHISTDQAGVSVALYGDALILGAPTYSKFFLFARTGGVYAESLQIEPKNGYLGDAGRSVSMLGSTLVVGSPATHPSVAKAYIYNVDASNLMPSVYCPPKPTTANCDPQIYHVNLPSISGAALGEKYMVRAIPVHGLSKGMLMYSTAGPAGLPFQGGTLCLAPPIARTTLLYTAGSGPCWGQLEFDFNAWIGSGKDPSLRAGQQVWFQYWYRDPTAVSSSLLGLSGGLTAAICP